MDSDVNETNDDAHGESFVHTFNAILWVLLLNEHLVFVELLHLTTIIAARVLLKKQHVEHQSVSA